MAEAISTGNVRRLLQAVLIGDSDLEAFCLDYFPETHRRFSSGMDRVGKLNLLLAMEDAQEIVSRLAEADPARFTRHRILLRSPSYNAIDLSDPKGERGAQKVPSRTEPRERSREELFDLLCGMPASQFEIVVFHLNLRTAILVPKTAPQSERALQIIEILGSNGSAALSRLTAAIAKTAPEFLK